MVMLGAVWGLAIVVAYGVGLYVMAEQNAQLVLRPWGDASNLLIAAVVPIVGGLLAAVSFRSRIDRAPIVSVVLAAFATNLGACAHRGGRRRIDPRAHPVRPGGDHRVRVTADRPRRGAVRRSVGGRKIAGCLRRGDDDCVADQQSRARVPVDRVSVFHGGPRIRIQH